MATISDLVLRAAVGVRRDAGVEVAGIRHRVDRFVGAVSALARRLGLAVIFGAALTRAAMAQPSTAFDGQYVGELTLVGVIQGDCTTPPLGALYPLTISQGQVRFLYTPRFSTTLIGTIDKNGIFKAAARAHKGMVTMTGRIRGDNVTATIQSPSCNYNFQTRR